MVELDGSLVEITVDTQWETVFFRLLKGGSFTIYRKKFAIGTFSKNVNIGGWSFAVSHKSKAMGLCELV